MDFNLNANDRSQGWKFSLSHQQAQKSMGKQRKSGRNEMQLKTGREAWKNSKTGILANISQSVRNHCEFRNVLATSSQSQFALRNSQATCTVHLSHIKLQKLSEISHCQLRKPHCQFRKPHCQFRKPLCQIRNPLPNSQIHCQIRKPIAKFANHFAKFANHFANFATALPNSQSIAKFTSFAKFTFAGLVILCN